MLPKDSLYPQSVLDRFWAKVDIQGHDDCWLWTAAKSKSSNYGFFHPHKPLTVGAHRFSLELKLGRPIKPGMYACHTCDNPPCVNPSHLYEGTHQNNVDDAVRRDRHKRGERGAAKLTELDVINIRIAVAGGAKSRDMAAVYMVTEGLISGIVRGYRWSSVGGPLTKHYKKEAA